VPLSSSLPPTRVTCSHHPGGSQRGQADGAPFLRGIRHEKFWYLLQVHPWAGLPLNANSALQVQGGPSRSALPPQAGSLTNLDQSRAPCFSRGSLSSPSFKNLQQTPPCQLHPAPPLHLSLVPTPGFSSCPSFHLQCPSLCTKHSAMPAPGPPEFISFAFLFRSLGLQEDKLCPLL
jgi:hypothetical protein